MRLGLRRVAVLAGVLSLLRLAVASAASPPPPTAPDQPLRDGCQRDQVGVVFVRSPEWVYVYRNPALRVAQGLVRISHVAKEDTPGEHLSHDYNANLVPDPRYRYVVGGSPSSMTSNYADPGAEDYRRLHFEWETGAVPGWAWPTDGDRAKLWGSWIWDCGHWTGPNGRISGEGTEFHPLTALAVTRYAPYLPRTTETETDVFISSNGTQAHAVEQCALQIPPSQYGSKLQGCAQFDVRKRWQPTSGRYSFFVPAPPRPSASAHLRYRVLVRIPGNAGREQITATAKGLRVTVTIRAPAVRAGKPVRYGKSFFVGWTGPQRTHATTLKVTLNSLAIVHADPDLSDHDPGGGKWNLNLDLNGYLRLLNDWAPALRSVTDGQVVPIHRTVTINVPAGRPLSLLVQGRECDIPSGKVLFGQYVPVVAPCPVNRDEPQLRFSNDDPGVVLDVYRSARAALGTHLSRSVATTNGFPGSGPITFGDGVQGNDDYELSYTVRPA